jgi:hypothetical protein
MASWSTGEHHPEGVNNNDMMLLRFFPSTVESRKLQRKVQETDAVTVKLYSSLIILTKN